MEYNTEQESFWAGDFGDHYIERNKGKKIIANNLNFFCKALDKTRGISNCIEFGANIGMNIVALKSLFPKIKIKAVEINEEACNRLEEHLDRQSIINKSIFEYEIDETFDLILIKTVLIHINPEKLNDVYEILYKSSKKYILIAEYYNPNPTVVKYRGHSDKLFKRDFAGEIMKKYNDLDLVDYGFIYHRDKNFPQDDLNWFLLEKK